MTIRPLYRITADRETGAWLGEPEEIGTREAADRPTDTDAVHYDSFERGDGVTCEIDVYWTTVES